MSVQARDDAQALVARFAWSPRPAATRARWVVCHRSQLVRALVYCRRHLPRRKQRLPKRGLRPSTRHRVPTCHKMLLRDHTSRGCFHCWFRSYKVIATLQDCRTPGWTIGVGGENAFTNFHPASQYRQSSIVRLRVTSAVCHAVNGVSPRYGDLSNGPPRGAWPAQHILCVLLGDGAHCAVPAGL